jgi:hypothetical protein
MRKETQNIELQTKSVAGDGSTGSTSSTLELNFPIEMKIELIRSRPTKFTQYRRF